MMIVYSELEANKAVWFTRRYPEDYGFPFEIVLQTHFTLGYCEHVQSEGTVTTLKHVGREMQNSGKMAPGCLFPGPRKTTSFVVPVQAQST